MNTSYYYGSLRLKTEGKGGHLYDYEITEFETVKVVENGWNSTVTVRVKKGYVYEHHFFDKSHGVTTRLEGRLMTFSGVTMTEGGASCYTATEGTSGIPKFESWERWKFTVHYDNAKIKWIEIPDRPCELCTTGLSVSRTQRDHVSHSLVKC